MDILGDITFELVDENTLFENQSEYTFVCGDAIAAPDYSRWTGNWYRSGDLTESYYTFFEDGTCTLYHSFLEQTGDPETYSWLTVMRVFNYGDSIKSLQLKVGDESFGPSFYVSEDGLVLVGDMLSEDYYVHEDAIGTPQVERTLRQYVLTNRYWTNEETYLQFSDNMTVQYMEVIDSTFETTQWGEWTLTDDGATIVWEDGSEDALYFAENTFTMDGLAGSFRKA